MIISFSSFLALFIVLKLCGIITWSWLWVLSPLWVGIVIDIAIILFWALFAILIIICS